MTGAEKGFLLLCSNMGDPARRVLSAAQMRILAQRVQTLQLREPERELMQEDLLAMGYGREMAGRILRLLEDESLAEHYCRRGKRADCFLLTPISPGYPARLLDKLGEETTGCLWYKGDLSILEQPSVALVGSRDLREENRAFANALGVAAARQGYALVSGNARGADQTAQRACLQAGGSVISVVADALEQKCPQGRILYLSEEEFDAPFSAQRAIHRNRVIHALGRMTFVAQCRAETGGTWNGTANNLRHGWSDVFCFDDGTEAMRLLQGLGAQSVRVEDLADLSALRGTRSLFDE